MSTLYHAKNVGIRGIYVYFPRMMVQQEDLEAADGCKGKYTVGLGQQQMTFCGDREDVVSMAATAVLRLMEGSGVRPRDIGRIEVGTETGVDRSKSVMSYLVQYFNEAGNYTVQGADHMHGCYGGTSALFTVTDWVSSPSWDGRLGLVVATDIAVYPPGSAARPTGGCGAAAMLIGPDAPLVVEPWPWRASFSCHTFDFFKPHGHPLYPVVDGPATLLWFTKAGDACAAQLYEQLQHHGLLKTQQDSSSTATQQQQQPREQPREQPLQHAAFQQQHQQQQHGLLANFDYFLSHSPYNKIVRKVFARLVLHDGLLRCQHQQQQEQQGLQQQSPEQQLSQQLQHTLAVNGAAASDHKLVEGAAPISSTSSSRPPLPPLPAEAAGLDLSGPLPDSSIQDKALERALLSCSSALYEAMASPGASLQRQLGNLYTASLYSSLASLLAQEGQGLQGKRLLSFSFGSGVVASMFTLTARATGNGSSSSAGSCAGVCGGSRQCEQQAEAMQQQQQQQGKSWESVPCSLQSMADQLRLPQRLSARLPRSVADFDAAMASLRAAYNSAPYSPSYGSLDDLEPGTVYLDGIDGSFRRSYGRRPL